jgi:hypothetical protein
MGSLGMLAVFAFGWIKIAEKSSFMIFTYPERRPRQT